MTRFNTGPVRPFIPGPVICLQRDPGRHPRLDLAEARLGRGGPQQVVGQFRHDPGRPAVRRGGVGTFGPMRLARCGGTSARGGRGQGHWPIDLPLAQGDTRPALLAAQHASVRVTAATFRPSARYGSALATISGGSFGYPVVVIVASEPIGDTISRVVSDDLSAETGDGIGSQHLRSVVTFAPCSAIFTVDCRDAVLRTPLKSEHLKLCGWPLSLSFLIHVLQAVSATFRLGRHTAWTANPVRFCDYV